MRAPNVLPDRHVLSSQRADDPSCPEKSAKARNSGNRMRGCVFYPQAACGLKKTHLQSREERGGRRGALSQRPRRCRIHSAGRKKHTGNSFRERRAAPGSQRGTAGPSPDASGCRCKIKKIVPAVGCGLLLSLAIPAAFCQKPVTPPEITPPPGNVLFLATHAQGTQNYICEPSSNGKAGWVFFSPQATLFAPLGNRSDRQAATHYLSPIPGATSPAPAGCAWSAATGEVSCPTWQSSLDSSEVWGEKEGSIQAGSDASCPNSGAIPCLLLGAAATRRGPEGSDLLAKTTFIQRLNTEGGSAPAGACSAGDEALAPYSADYYLYKAEAGESERAHPANGALSF
jgi:hypothetical protein